MREFTWTAAILGIVIGALFAAANTYVGLKAGMTINPSIAAAVMALAILRGILRRGTILECNIVQTIGSAGESLAGGMIFTLPALIIFGFDVNVWQMTLWGAAGGLLGVLCMIPLRRMLIVREHGKLIYPEGLACAEVLRAGEQGGASARPVFWGVAVGGVYEFFRGLGFWPETARMPVPGARTAVMMDASPALLGVGYILGIRVASFMLAGAILGWFILIPAVAFFGAAAQTPIFPEKARVIAEMSPEMLHSRYVRYVGAGAVVVGGLISVIRSLRTIAGSLGHMARTALRRGADAPERTDRDIPLPLLALAVIALGAVMWFRPEIPVGHIGAACVIIFGFFFVAVSSRLVGLVGSSSNPASGMTIATLLATSLVFRYLFNMTGDEAKFAIIVVGALVCMAITISGDVSQDLKTGFLVGATPWKQQVGELIGVLTSTALIAGVILLIGRQLGYVADETHPNPVVAPQANLMKLVVEGIVDGKLPWLLVVIGMFAGLIVELLGLPALPFAVGLYLPLGLSMPIVVGALIRWLVERVKRREVGSHDPGILGASGLLAGYGLMGIAMILVSALIGLIGGNPMYRNPWTGESEPVSTEHFAPWLTTGVMGLADYYGLSTIERGPFTALYAVDPFRLLPVIPFVLVILWLLPTALRSPSPVPVAAGAPPPPESPGDAPHVADLRPPRPDEHG